MVVDVGQGLHPGQAHPAVVRRGESMVQHRRQRSGEQASPTPPRQDEREDLGRSGPTNPVDPEQVEGRPGARRSRGPRGTTRPAVRAPCPRASSPTARGSWPTSVPTHPGGATTRGPARSAFAAGRRRAKDASTPGRRRLPPRDGPGVRTRGERAPSAPRASAWSPNETSAPRPPELRTSMVLRNVSSSARVIAQNQLASTTPAETSVQLPSMSCRKARASGSSYGRGTTVQRSDSGSLQVWTIRGMSDARCARKVTLPSVRRGTQRGYESVLTASAKRVHRRRGKRILRGHR